jgi:hypothetical protein
MLVMVSSDQLNAQVVPCPVGPDTGLTKGLPLISAGTYSITLVATRGPQTGGKATGDLVLNETRATDRSPRTGQRARAAENLAEYRLWGWITADLTRIGAPLPYPTDTLTARPDSRDPVNPGALAWNSRGTETISIASSMNFRGDKDYMSFDGPGIMLGLQSLDSATLRGVWYPAGDSPPRRGYFCARKR